MTEVIVRPDRGKRPYRLRCRFTVGAYSLPSWLEKAKYQAADRFVEDMRKQGFEHVPSHGFKMTGPYPVTETVTLPKRSAQPQWHTPSRNLMQRIQGDRPIRAADRSYARTVPRLDETEKWEFELSGVFLHDTILTESPDAVEEREVLKKR